MSMLSRMHRPAILNVLDRVAPEYMWQFGVMQLARIYEQRSMSITLSGDELRQLCLEGILDVTRLPTDEVYRINERLIQQNVIKQGELAMPHKSDPRTMRGYRLTQYGHHVFARRKIEVVDPLLIPEYSLPVTIPSVRD